MKQYQLSERFGRLSHQRRCAALLLVAVLTLAACSRSVGGDDVDAGANNNQNTNEEAPDAALPPDAGSIHLEDELGWYSEAFEHVAFVPESLADLSRLQDHCDPYIMAMDGEGNSVSATSYVTGKVTGIDYQSGETKLLINDQQISISSLIRVEETTSADNQLTDQIKGEEL